MTRMRIGFGTALLVAITHGVVAAQSLADIARLEEERRKTVAVPGKVYTNESLRYVSLPPLPPLPAPTVVPTAPADAASAPADGEDPAGADRGEAYWRQRMEDHREAARRARLFAEALQSRINALTADFTARDDPAQRDLIAQDRQRALEELERIQQEIAERTTAIADTEEEARRAGVPPGWLR